MHPWVKEHWLPGVLSKDQIKQLVDDVYITGLDNFNDAADYSSFDLTLSDEGYKMKLGSIKPCGENYVRILNNPDFAERLSINEEGYFPLEAKKCYVFKLKEKLTAAKLNHSSIYGMATAKSSIGRMDVIGRLIIDGMYQYEYLNPDSLENSTGDMFLEIIPISFNVCVKPRISLSQLRLFYGDPNESLITNKNFIKEILLGSSNGEGYLSVDLRNTDIGGLEVASLRANISSEVYINLWEEKDVHKKPDPCQHWCFVKSDEKRLLLKTNSFYLLRSKERIALPSRVAVYARPMDETLGEMRIHYAGFVHPYFGLNRSDKQGTPLIFEVRAHNVNVNLNDKERLAKLIFFRMSEEAKKDKEPSYNSQELKVSNLFGDWPSKLKYKNETEGTVEGF